MTSDSVKTINYLEMLRLNLPAKVASVTSGEAGESQVVRERLPNHDGVLLRRLAHRPRGPIDFLTRVERMRRLNSRMRNVRCVRALVGDYLLSSPRERPCD